MKNIFKDSYFGKAYKTRDGRKAIIVSLSDEGANLAVDIKIKGTIFDSGVLKYYLNGKSRFHTDNEDIVSEWQEEFNEEELDELAEEYIQGFDYAIEISPNPLSLKKDKALAKSMFKVGYKAAKKEE